MSDGLRPLADGEAPGPNERRVSMVAGSGGPRFSPHYYFEHNGQLLHKPGPTALQVAPAASAEECVAIDPFYRQVVGHFAVDPNAAKRVYDPRTSGPLVQEQCRPAVLAILDSIIPGMHKLAGEHNLSDETKIALAQDIAGLEDVIGAFCTRHNIPRGDAANRPGARQKTAAVPPPPSV